MSIHIRRKLIERKGSFASWSIPDYFVQNFADRLRTSVKVFTRKYANPSARENVFYDATVVFYLKQGELADVQNYGAHLAVCISRLPLTTRRGTPALSLLYCIA